MRYVLALILMLAAPAVLADSIARRGDNWVRTTEQPCTEETVLQHLPPGLDAKDFRAAAAHFDGQDFAACWISIPGGAAVLYDDGDSGVIREQELQPDSAGI